LLPEEQRGKQKEGEKYLLLVISAKENTQIDREIDITKYNESQTESLPSNKKYNESQT
jgi:hypothetical protein